MSIEMIQDDGQTLSKPRGKVLGLVETQQQLGEVGAALQQAGFEDVKAIQGEDGVNLLERLDGFFLGDCETPILRRHIDELKAGKFVISITTSADQAQAAAKVAAENGARFLVHFGMFTTTWLEE